MNFFESKVFERVCWVVMIIATIYFGVMIVLAYQEGPPLHSQQFTPTEKAEIKQLHKKHGIWSSVVCGVTGERYFYRDGRKCSL